MIRYDWTVLRHYDIKNIINVLFTISSNDQRASKTILRILTHFKEKDSFLANSNNLVKLNTHTDLEIYQYIDMASLRSYEIYNHTGDITLPIHYLSDEVIMDISDNTALIIDKDKIIFKYEV